MLINLHKNATTTPAIREAIQNATGSDYELARQFNVTRDTIRKWRSRDTVADGSHTPHRLQSTLNAGQKSPESTATAYFQCRKNERKAMIRRDLWVSHQPAKTCPELTDVIKSGLRAELPGILMTVCVMKVNAESGQVANRPPESTVSTQRLGSAPKIADRIVALREAMSSGASEPVCESAVVADFGNFGNDWGKDSTTGFDNFNQFGKD